jgi:multidrug efflux pump subunit AcrA (membrane-fusion protein)
MRLALLAAVAALVGCLLLVLLAPSSRSPQQATAQAHPTVTGPRASRSSSQAEEFLGVVLPQESVELAAPFEGMLARVAVKVGDRVQAGTELAQLDRGQLEPGTLRAPFEGLVSVRYLDPGAKVQSGTPLFRLIRAGQLRVRFAVPDTHGITFSAGTPVRILLPEQGRRLSGKVESISPEVDTASRMFFALALLDAEGDARTAVSGMVARVSLDTALSPAAGSSAPPPATSKAE